MTEGQEFDLGVAGRQLHVYTIPAVSDPVLTVYWHHGTPNVGSPPAPLVELSRRLGVSWVSHDRPGYGRSSPAPGRSIGSMVGDVAAIADHLEISRFAVMGHSGGGPHALACAALLPDRVIAAVSGSGLAPFQADGLGWLDGMYSGGEAELNAAANGRAALTALLEEAAFDPEMFTTRDHEALSGEWAWLNEVAGKGLESGLNGMIDDDLAYVASWGFDPAAIEVPVLLMHGEDDRIVPADHSRWLNERIVGSELWLSPSDGHISVLRRAPAALQWLVDNGALGEDE